MKLDNLNNNFVLCFILFMMLFLIIYSLFSDVSTSFPTSLRNSPVLRTYEFSSSSLLEGLAPYVMSNTLVETSKDHLEKITHMEDTCGNYMHSDYNLYNHSRPRSTSSWSTQPYNVTSDSCEIFQRFVSDTCGNSSCNSICTNPNQYYDITTATCEYCPIGYGVENNRNNKCIRLETCPNGMKYVDNTGTCLPCPDGKKYDNGINCVNKCLDYQNLNADGTCTLKCPSRTQRWDPVNKCVNCPAGYIADGHNNCVPAPTCSPGLILDSNNNCVAKCTANWERYEKTTNSCVQICLPNQQYKNGSCIDCPNGGMGNGNNGCLPGPTTPPLTCPEGYNLVNNKCESSCPIWKKNNLINPSLCDPICHRNTQYFDQPTHSCLSCPPGKISDGNNGCKDAPTPAPTQLVCTPGYELNSSGTACNSICPPWRQNNLQNPSKCDVRCPKSTHTYYDTTQFACMDCPNGGTTDNNNTCIAPTTTPPPPPPPIKQPPPTLPPTTTPPVTYSHNLTFTSDGTNMYINFTYSGYVQVTFGLYGDNNVDYAVLLNGPLGNGNQVLQLPDQYKNPVIIPGALPGKYRLIYSFVKPYDRNGDGGTTPWVTIK